MYYIPSEHQRLARRGAASIFAAFQEYGGRFLEITRRAKSRFEVRDWQGMQHDALERLELYGEIVSRQVTAIRDLLDCSIKDRKLWASIKVRYCELIVACRDHELAETFFNSMSRRIFSTIGVDPRIEFLASETNPPRLPGKFMGRIYDLERPLAEVIALILSDCEFMAAFEDLGRDSKGVAEAIESECRALDWSSPPRSIELIRSVFYRNQGAFIVGRVCGGGEYLPLCLALRHEERGIVVDAALLSPDDISVVFSFTRSYLHVESDRPSEMISCLRSIMPRKPLAELYIAIGYNKHGKTELYRDLIRHINTSADHFEQAPGDRGMVMIVFVLASFDVVFKIVRDQFGYPKTTTRRDVLERYQLVFKHDRAGRLVDAQEFEHLSFDRVRFSKSLLEELAAEARDMVIIDDQSVHIKHLYVERRMIPLNLYLQDAPQGPALDAVLDYGQAVKDLAATNIFPGDMLLKNFGVTRHRRVVFYDYDELCLVTQCQFRELPAAREDCDEYRSEPWFYVGPNDVFPEEFMNFLGLYGDRRRAFLQHHGELITARYWKDIQDRHRAGSLIDIIPYPQSKRLTEAHPLRSRCFSEDQGREEE